MSAMQTRVSPIVAIAAVSVIIFSAVGIGVMTGFIPSSFSKSAEQPPATEQPTTAAATQAVTNAQPGATSARATADETPRVAAAESPKPALRICADCGKVTTINIVEQQGEGTGLGAVAGGVVGGVLGNQIGRGTGRKLATVAGAAGGAYVGHQAEKSIKTTKRWDVAVRMENGSTRMFSFDQEPAFRVGDSVRLRDGGLVLN